MGMSCAAGILEMGWAVGLKYTEGFTFTRLWPTVFTVLSMILSIGLLGLAVRTLPIGTAYAVWTGIGTLGTAILGVMPVSRACDRRAHGEHHADRCGHHWSVKLSS
jgi:quaternary ammonium compound-resistance protein SugE